MGRWEHDIGVRQMVELAEHWVLVLNDLEVDKKRLEGGEDRLEMNSRV